MKKRLLLFNSILLFNFMGCIENIDKLEAGSTNILKNRDSYIRDDHQNIVIDNITGLMWQDNINIKKKWKDAKKYCSDLKLGIYSDWRLPTRREMFSIIDYGKYAPSLNSVFKSYNNVYWTNTVYVKSKKKRIFWSVNSHNGKVFPKYSSVNQSVRCVRVNEKRSIR